MYAYYMSRVYNTCMHNVRLFYSAHKLLLQTRKLVMRKFNSKWPVSSNCKQLSK